MTLQSSTLVLPLKIILIIHLNSLNNSHGKPIFAGTLANFMLAGVCYATQAKDIYLIFCKTKQEFKYEGLFFRGEIPAFLNKQKFIFFKST